MFRAVALAAAALGMCACVPAFEEGDDCNNGVDDDGDGFVDCDDPNCALSPLCGTCGDGHVDPGEGCDDGNVVDGDGCSSRCLNEHCGNGVLEVGEECDDGNLIPADGCSALCKRDFCGDGVLQADIEECEDGNRLDGDGCSSTCHAEPLPGCGDGNLAFDPQTGQQLEQCDDRNRQSGDGCSSSCTFEFCGDGVTEPGLGEECDDADPHKPLGCAGCRLPRCGDFVLSPGEQCDDGPNNGQPGDRCSAQCTLI